MAHDKFDDDDEQESNEVEKKELKKDKPLGTAGDADDADGEATTKRKRKRKRKKKSGDASGPTETNNAASSEMTSDKLNSLDHTVYVEGIPFVCSEDEVKKFFVSNGCEDVLQMRLPT